MIPGSPDYQRAWRRAERLLRDNGASYHPHASDGDAVAVRPWALDPQPLRLDAASWRTIEAGVAQRARLLNAMLDDAYGPRRLVRDGLLPPGALYAHPGLLRPCQGWQPARGRRLTFYACDLVQGDEGAWLAACDRAQAPGGCGAALEHRVVLAQAFSEALTAEPVRRLAPFFISMRRALADLAPRHRDNPRIVLLTPGPWHEGYFEHAYLARYLGYPLVEGGDLAVRDGGVFLKTLGGLLSVDVIVRRQDDELCDPLELRDDSTLGVPGLLQALRDNTVAMANAPGTGLADNPAWHPFLPQVARALLGEPLLLSSLPVLWGEDDPAALIAGLDRLAVRPLTGRREDLRLGWTLGAAERAALAAEISARPYAFVGQQPPAQGDGTVLRVFAVATGDSDGHRDDWTVMPGGLVRSGLARGAAWTVLGPGGGVRDCWIAAEGPVPAVSLLRPSGAPVVFRRSGADLPSRLADHLYWMGRYAERLEGTVRLVRAVLQRSEDHTHDAERAALGGALRHLGLASAASAASEKGEPLAAARMLMDDRAQGGGFTDVILRLRQTAFAVRDRIANDAWRIINQLDAEARRESGDRGERIAACDRLVVLLAALAGLGQENTTRGPGWRFLDLGRRIERAQTTADLLRGALAGERNDPLSGLDAVLDVCDSTLTYRSRYLAWLDPAAVIDLLLTDTSNPRALAFQLDAAVDHVRHLPGADSNALPTQAERLALGAYTWVRVLDPRDLCREDDEDHTRPRLAHVLDHLASDLNLLSDAVTSGYLSHSEAQRNLSS